MSPDGDDRDATPAPPGTAAIDARVDAADGGPAEHRYHPRAPHRLSGSGPVEQVTAHRVPAGTDGWPHWHLVTYGLTELDAKESPDPEISGWGFELTIRVEDDGEEPRWAVDLLANLAAYVWSSQHPFAPGHHLDLSGPIKLDSDSPITAAVAVEDPALGAFDGPFGSVEFVQVVGITADELELCRSWSTEGVVELLQRDDPLLVTRLQRPSLVASGRYTTEIAERSRQEGSDLHELRVATLRVSRRWRGKVVAQMGAGASSALGHALRRELVAPGASFCVVGDSGSLCFVVGEEWSWQAVEGDIEAALPLDGVAVVAGLFDGRTGSGSNPGWPDLRFRVVP